MALRTPLYDDHAAAGATFTEFAGFDMPVHFGPIKDEHMAVREAVGLFDVSHMSNLWVHGDGAAEALGAVMPFDPASLAVGKAKYTTILDTDGTIVDDTIVFRTDEDRFLVIPNAGRNEDVAAHLEAHTPAPTTIDDVSRETAIFAVQGPNARAVAKALGMTPPKRFTIHADTIDGTPVWATGTGYTGEKGFELCLAAADAPRVWQAILQAGADHGIRRIGLAARDTLRLEQGYCLAGHEFKGGRTPVEAGLSWLVDRDHDALGMDVVRRQLDEGAKESLWGLVLEKGVPREGFDVLRDGAVVGRVTSGTMSPCLGKGIALAYLQGASEGDVLQVDVRGRPRDARVVRPPFL